MTLSIAKVTERRVETIPCRRCRAKTELIVSMIHPKDADRRLHIFKCNCGAMTSSDDSG
jgi:hypothetical protein